MPRYRVFIYRTILRRAAGGVPVRIYTRHRTRYVPGRAFITRIVVRYRTRLLLHAVRPVIVTARTDCQIATVRKLRGVRRVITR